MAIQLETSLGSYDMEDSRTKEKYLCFEVCALCLSSTMESSRCTCGGIWWNVVLNPTGLYECLIVHRKT